MTNNRSHSLLIEALQENNDYLKSSGAVYTDQNKSFNSKAHFFSKKEYNFQKVHLIRFIKADISVLRKMMFTQNIWKQITVFQRELF